LCSNSDTLKLLEITLLNRELHNLQIELTALRE
jgi:hypothetical protein